MQKCPFSFLALKFLFVLHYSLLNIFLTLSYIFLSHILSINRTSNRVLTTVMGISKAPDIERAVMPKEIACRAVNGSSKSKACFSQCNDEKYRPTPGITLVIDCKLTFVTVIDASSISNYKLIFQNKGHLTGVMPFQSPKTFSFWTMFATVPNIPFLGDLFRRSIEDIIGN